MLTASMVWLGLRLQSFNTINVFLHTRSSQLPNGRKTI